MTADRDALLAAVHAQAAHLLAGRPTRDSVLAAVAACHATAGTAIGDRLAEAETLGERPACRAGCAFCCHQHIAVTPAELLGIAAEVTAWPAKRIESLRRRLEQDAPRIAVLDHAGRQAARIACPMLDRKTGQCGAYDRRPVACRSHFSTLRTACERDFRTRGARRPNDKGVPTMESPKATAGAALVGLELALDELGLAVEPVELAVGLHLALNQPEVFDRWLTGENPFPPLPAPPSSARARLGRSYSDMLRDVRARLAPARKTSDKGIN